VSEVPAVGVVRVDVAGSVSGPGVAEAETLCVVVTQDGAAVGELLVRGRDAETQGLLAVISRRLGDELWRRRVAADVRALAAGGTAARAHPNVTVLIDGSAHGADIRRCVDSVRAADVAPNGVVVVGQGEPALDHLRAATAADGLVAVLDGACAVDPGWLDAVAETFTDPLVLASVGYVGPAKISTIRQYALRLGDDPPAQGVIDGFGGAQGELLGRRPAGSIYRASVLQSAADTGGEAAGLLFDPGFHADLRAHILAAGGRIALDPRSIVWQREPADAAGARRASFVRAACLAGAARGLMRSGTRRAALALLRHELGRQLRTLIALPRLKSWTPAPVAFAALRGLAAGFVRGKRRDTWQLTRELLSPAPRQAVSNVRPDAPALSVAISSYNRRDSLVDLLTALAQQTYPRERFEVIVALDGSTDGSQEVAQSFEPHLDIRVVWQENRGPGAAANRGAREARSPLIVFLDDDTVPEPELLAVHATAHRDAQADHVALGYCPPVITDTGLWALTYRQWWEDYYRRKGEPGHRWTYLDFGAANSSMRRSLLEAVGWYDEEFGGRRQDWELGARLLAHGADFGHNHAAVARHYLDATFDSALARAHGEARADLVLASKHPHLIGSLPFAGVLRAAPYRLPRRVSLAYRHRRASRLTARAARHALDVFERLDQRRAWRRVSRALLWHAYLAGLREEVGSLGALEDLLAPVLRSDEVRVVQLWLDDPHPERLPAMPAAVDLEVGYAGVPLARAPVWFPGEQWDWAVVADRVAAGVRAPKGKLPRVPTRG